MPPVTPPGPESLWRLEIGRRGEVFKGLMLLKTMDTDFDMVILDPTGITLVGGRVDFYGRVTVNGGLARVKETGLAPLVGRGLARIFHRPGGQGRNGCRRGREWLRYFEVCDDHTAIRLDNPWPEPDLKLVRIR